MCCCIVGDPGAGQVEELQAIPLLVSNITCSCAWNRQKSPHAHVGLPNPGRDHHTWIHECYPRFVMCAWHRRREIAGRRRGHWLDAELQRGSWNNPSTWKHLWTGCPAVEIQYAYPCFTHSKCKLCENFITASIVRASTSSSLLLACPVPVRDFTHSVA